MMRHPESLAALAIATQPPGQRGAILVRGVRPGCVCTGEGHRFRFHALSPGLSAAAPLTCTTLLCVGSVRCPGGGQFEPAYVRRELGKTMLRERLSPSAVAPSRAS